MYPRPKNACFEIGKAQRLQRKLIGLSGDTSANDDNGGSPHRRFAALAAFGPPPPAVRPVIGWDPAVVDSIRSSNDRVMIVPDRGGLIGRYPIHDGVVAGMCNTSRSRPSRRKQGCSNDYDGWWKLAEQSKTAVAAF